MGDAITPDTVLQRLDNRALSDNFGKIPWSGLSGENKIRHASPERAVLQTSAGRKNDSRAICGTRRVSLPLLPSGPGGVHDSSLRRTRLSNLNPGWRRGRDSNSRYLRTHAFQACTLSHSVTSPVSGAPIKRGTVCILSFSF